MANNVSNVGFFGPQALAAALSPDTYAKQQQLQVQQQLAQGLMGEGMRPIDPNRSSGRFVVPISPFEGLAHTGQALAGALMQKNAIKQQSDLATQQAKNLMGYAFPQQQPTNPMIPGQPGSSVMAGGGSTVPETPQAPQPQGQGQDFLQLAAITSLYGPQAAELAVKRMQQPLVNVRPGGVVFDPNTNKPLFSAPQNGMQTQWGPNGPTQGVVPGFQAGQTQLSQTPLFNAPMQTVKLSNQRELQLSQPEYLQYTQSGGQVLPSRYQALSQELPGVRFQDVGQAGQQPQQQPMGQPTQVPQAPQVPPVSQVGGRPERAVVGATQSQGEQVNQARQTAAGKAVDEQFAKDYVAFTTGGASDAAKQLGQLHDVVNELQNPQANLTGPVLGHMPDAVKSFTNPEAIAMRERVEEVVQRSLRSILGAQFTEREGERLIARAYNPNLPESENAIRVNRLFTQLQQAFDAKQSAAQYFEKNGTLDGWKGKLPTIDDFEPDARSTQGAIKKKPADQRPLSPQEQRELEQLRKRFGR